MHGESTYTHAHGGGGKAVVQLVVEVVVAVEVVAAVGVAAAMGAVVALWVDSRTRHPRDILAPRLPSRALPTALPMSPHARTHPRRQALTVG